MEPISCPHCGQTLQAFELPESSGWDTGFHLACFNDDCPYYRRGWERMAREYSVKASYRYRVNPATGKALPLAVWSAEALKNRIIEATASIVGESQDQS